jgi:hypothetical protein
MIFPILSSPTQPSPTQPTYKTLLDQWWQRVQRDEERICPPWKQLVSGSNSNYSSNTAPGSASLSGGFRPGSKKSEKPEKINIT